MKEPIEPSEIRAGDLIREEYAEPWHTDGGIPRLATEYTATPELKTLCRRKASGYFLLDRPKPAVVLPTEPTLGWLTRRCPGFFGRVNTSLETVWLSDDKSQVNRAGLIETIPVERVGAFTPATVVPSEALEKLRANPLPQRDITVFLAAVDAANEVQS